MKDNARFKVIICGRRFGKTTYAVSKLLKDALLNKDSKYFYIAPTYKQGKMIAWEMLKKQIRKLPKELVTKVNESELYVEVGNESQIHIKGADKEDSLRGVGLQGVVLDEYADMKPNVFREIIRPALTDTKGYAIFIGTPKGFNHLYDLYQYADKTEGWQTFKFTSYDNPMLDREEIEDAKRALPEDTFAQEYLADFRKLQGLVYKEFDRDKHIFIKEDPQAIETIGGIDWGYTNPYSMLVIKKDFDNTYWVMQERYEKGKTTPEIIEIAKQAEATYKINQWYPDPAEPDRIEEMKRAGMNVREVNKDVTLGIDKVRSILRSNKLKIHQSCENLIWELETYHYPDAKDGKNDEENPVKENDHAVDALRYALFSNQPTRADGRDDDFGLYESTYA